MDTEIIIGVVLLAVGILIAVKRKKDNKKEPSDPVLTPQPAPEDALGDFLKEAKQKAEEWGVSEEEAQKRILASLTKDVEEGLRKAGFGG